MFDLSDHHRPKTFNRFPLATARKPTFCFKYMDRAYKPESPFIPILKEMDYHACCLSGTFEILEK